MKRSVLSCMILFLCLSTFLFASGEQEVTESGETYTLRISTVISSGDPLYTGYESFAENVEKKTDGRMQVEIFPDAQLGQDEDVMEQALLGVDVAFNTDAGRLGVRVSEMGIILAPYLFDDPMQATEFMKSDLFKSWKTKLEDEHGLTLLSLNYYVGGRNFVTKKPISKPEDLQGLRIRTPGAPVWQETIRALGATPVALPWIETYPALQQGVIDGAEVQHSATYASKIYEMGDHISLTNHILLMNGLVVGTSWFKTLPEDIQDILVEESLIAGTLVTQMVMDSEQEFLDKMTAEGVTVHEVDLAPFRKRAEMAYEKLDLQDLRKEVRAIVE